MKSLSRPALALPVVLLAACGEEPPRTGLLLSKSVFAEGATTQPSMLEVYTPPETEEGKWTKVTIQEDPTVEILEEYDDKEVFPKGGNVFHKAFWFDPVHGEPGILTISANAAWMKIWREEADGEWQAEELWTGTVGGKENRLRDAEVADVDGDGQDEIVVVTHDHGVTLVFEQTPEGMQPTEVSKTEERTFVHEVEVGDVDGDGVAEFMTTPSDPNTFDEGASQPGRVALFQYEDGEYVESTVFEDEHRHAKEILCTDLDGSGAPELYSALETHSEDETLEILRFEWDASQGKMAGGKIIELPGKACRFLNAGDTNGDGVRELIASTHKQGILSIWQDEEGEWRHDTLAPAYMTGGFEHATVVFDMDGDGKDDVIAASDTQKSLNRFYYNPEYDDYDSEEIVSWPREMSLTWNVMPLPLD